MNTSKNICDCIGTEAEDALCAAADAMDTTLKAVADKEAKFYSYLVSKYGPSENID